MTVDLLTETKWIGEGGKFTNWKFWNKITANLEFYASKNEDHIFRLKKKTRELISGKTIRKEHFPGQKKKN
jgi:hypothetical protein